MEWPISLIETLPARRWQLQDVLRGIAMECVQRCLLTFAYSSELRSSESQGVRHDAYRAECHGPRGVDRVQQAKRRNWDADDIIDERPEEVLFNCADGALR